MYLCTLVSVNDVCMSVGSVCSCMNKYALKCMCIWQACVRATVKNWVNAGVCVRTPAFVKLLFSVTSLTSALQPQREIWCVCVCVISYELIVTVSYSHDNLSLSLVHADTCIHTRSPSFSFLRQSLSYADLTAHPLGQLSSASTPFLSPSFTLMVCLQPLYLPVSAGWAQPSIAQSSLLVLIQHKPFLPLYSVLPRPSAVPMHTSPAAAAAATRLHFVPSGEGSPRKQKQLRASLPAYNE